MSAVHDIARAALAVLGRSGVHHDGAWACATGQDGTRFDLSLAGPDLPSGVPAAIADGKLIAANLDWRGAYTLKVRAPRTVLEIAWSAGEPVRIMAFSRGAWEERLASLAHAVKAVR